MDQQPIRYDFTFKSWTVKELTIDKTTTAGQVFYNIKQEWLFKEELKGVIADIIINVVTDPNNPDATTIAHLRLSCDLDATGLTSNVPKELIGQIGLILLHTARGILLQAGAGTILAQFPVPIFTAEQLAGGQQQ
jgi:hypothetical protein